MNQQSRKSVEDIKPVAWRINDGAQRLSLSRASIYKLAATGKLRLIKIAGRTLIPDSEIERLANGEAM